MFAVLVHQHHTRITPHTDSDDAPNATLLAGTPQSLMHASLAVVTDPAFVTRMWLAVLISVGIYAMCGMAAAFMYPRVIRPSATRPHVLSMSVHSDVVLGVVSLVAGTPVIQFFQHAYDMYGASSGLCLYKGVLDHGVVWAVVSVPVYLLMWDAVFYVLHRWVLHSNIGYTYSHANHHAFRPPSAWSGIAIDPFEARGCMGHMLWPLTITSRSSCLVCFRIYAPCLWACRLTNIWCMR